MEKFKFWKTERSSEKVNKGSNGKRRWNRGELRG
ncbi:Uncharacterised protein [Wolbachia endosymbiont wPip_Mol of Culex molestus]|nr:Uncharacterised protein [Wolbachia endosymbiont wPip_Mol of Culex molestus]